MKGETKSYTVVVPVFNSSGNLDKLVNDFERVLTANGYSAELILVDDASNETTQKKAELLALEKNFVKTLRLKKNSGQIAATTCGIHRASGNIIITMDDDLQYPMDEVLKLIAHHRVSGKKIVFGYPRKRMHSFRHRVAAQLVIWLFDYIIMPRYRKINFYTTFRILDRSLFFDENKRPVKRHLFYLWEIPVANMDSIVVEHHVRKSGTSTYTLIKQMRHLLPQILITIFRLSLLGIAALIIIVAAWSSAGTMPVNLFYTMVIGCIFLAAVAVITQIFLERNRVVRYVIEKITG